MSQSHPAQNKDATEHTSGARRPNRSDAPSRRPPLDAPRPWKTEGLPTDKSSKSDKDKQHRSPRRWIFWVVSLFALFAVWGFLSWQDARSAPPAIWPGARFFHPPVTADTAFTRRGSFRPGSFVIIRWS